MLQDRYMSKVAGNVKVADDIKEVLRNDRQAWSVICALVLTISIPASMISTSDYNQENRYNNEASYIFITSISVCTTTSILVIWNSTYAYLKINQLESHKLSEYMHLISIKKKDNLLFLVTNSITILANLSFFSIAMLLVSAVYLFYGAIYFWISMPIISFGIISVIYNEYSIQTIFNSINNKIIINNNDDNDNNNIIMEEIPKSCNGCNMCNNLDSNKEKCYKLEELRIEKKRRKLYFIRNMIIERKKILEIEIEKQNVTNFCQGCSMCDEIGNCNRIEQLKKEQLDIHKQKNEVDLELETLNNQIDQTQIDLIRLEKKFNLEKDKRDTIAQIKDIELQIQKNIQNCTPDCSICNGELNCANIENNNFRDKLYLYKNDIDKKIENIEQLPININEIQWLPRRNINETEIEEPTIENGLINLNVHSFSQYIKK